MKVYSTLRPEQIAERRTQSEGVLGLKLFLRFAEHGTSMLTASAQSTENHSLIVEQIAEALRRKGYEVKTSIGSSALRVDLAIIDPLHSDRYALGIICDSSSYVQLKTARDREIVQPKVLQMLGWRLMHVWTVDWLQNPESVIEHISQEMKRC
jgi:hypothetical protein